MNQPVQDKVVSFSRDENQHLVLIECPTLVLSRSDCLVIEDRSNAIMVGEEQLAVIVEPGEYLFSQAQIDSYTLCSLDAQTFAYGGNFVINLGDCIKAVDLLSREVPLFSLGDMIVTLGHEKLHSDRFTNRESLFDLGPLRIYACQASSEPTGPEVYDTFIIGAGPYGTSAAIACRTDGLDAYWTGEPLSFWLRNIQPTHLRSVKAATNIFTGETGQSFIDFCNRYEISHSGKIRFWQFLAYYFYLLEYYQVMPAHEKVIDVTCRDDGWAITVEGVHGTKTVPARNVINATGIGMHPNVPPVMDKIPRRLGAHVSDYAVHALPENENIAVIGGAQSALEYALEADMRGNQITLYVRDQLIYRNLHEPSQFLYRFLATHCESIIGYLPVKLKTRLLGYLLEGTCEPQVAEEIACSNINVKEHVEIEDCQMINDHMVSVISRDGERHYDRLVAATGYHYDVHRIEYLRELMKEGKRLMAGRFPNLNKNAMLKHAPAGMYFTGYACIYAIGFKAQFINGTNIIIRRIINDIRRRG